MPCKRKNLIKNKFISAFIGTCGILIGVGFLFPLPGFSVYITSYIHEKQKFVTMYYGLFLHLIFSFSFTFGMSIGGFLELKFGFYLTTLSGLLIVLIGDLVFLNAQNIWLCYVLTFVMASGSGISNSLTGKNLAFFRPARKGLLVSILGAITTLFSAGFSISGEKLINPDGYTLNKTEEYYDYKYSSKTYIYFTMGFFTIPIGVIIFLLFIVVYIKKDSESVKEKEEIIGVTEEIKKSEDEENKDKDNNAENENENNENKKEKEEEEELIISKDIQEINKKKKIKKVIKTFRFWRLSIAQFLLTFSFSFIVGTGRTFGALIGINGGALQFLMLCHSGALIIVGPLLGFFVDKKGALFFLRIVSLILMVPGILLTFFTTNTYIFMGSFVISVLGLVSTIVCYAPFIMEIYGIQESVILGGIMNIFSRFSEVITTIVAFVVSLFYNKEEILLPYRIMYIVGSGCCLLSFILLMFEKKDKFNYDDNDVDNNDIKEDLGDIVENSRFTEANV